MQITDEFYNMHKKIAPYLSEASSDLSEAELERLAAYIVNKEKLEAESNKNALELAKAIIYAAIALRESAPAQDYSDYDYYYDYYYPYYYGYYYGCSDCGYSYPYYYGNRYYNYRNYGRGYARGGGHRGYVNHGSHRHTGGGYGGHRGGFGGGGHRGGRR
jgi:hypothetical protein